MGELEVRGPWIASRYFDCPKPPTCSPTTAGSGPATLCRLTTVASSIQDRAKDVIKSGGEWISSVALEIAADGASGRGRGRRRAGRHPKWAERPLAVVVLRVGHSATPEALRDFLAPHFPKFWLPDAFEFIEAIPRTSAGKFREDGTAGEIQGVSGSSSGSRFSLYCRRGLRPEVHRPAYSTKTTRTPRPTFSRRSGRFTTRIW